MTRRATSRRGPRRPLWLISILGALAITLMPLSAAPAAAQLLPSLLANPVSVLAGESITVSGAGFPALRAVDLTWDGGARLGFFRPFVRLDGTFTTRVTVPKTATPGPHTIRAVAGSSQASVPVDIVSSTAATATATAAATAPATAMPTVAEAPSATPTVLAAPTDTPTATASATPSATRTPTPLPATATSELQATPTRTPTLSRTPTATRTGTATKSPTATRTATRTPTTAPTATRTATRTATPTAPPGGSQQARVHELVNAARIADGKAPLAYNGALTAAAQSYAQLMANTGCFSHTCPPVSYFVDRVVLAGYTPWTFLGENIAGGQQTADEVMEAWMNSSGHRSNILSATYSDIGVGMAEGGPYGIYWVQEFGSQD